VLPGQLCRTAIKAVERYNQVIHLSESRKRGWLEINRFPEIIFRSVLRWPRWESEGTFCQTMKKIGRCHLWWEIRSFSELCSELRTTLSRHFDAQKQTFKKMMIENFLIFYRSYSLACLLLPIMREVKMKKKKFLSVHCSCLS